MSATATAKSLAVRRLEQVQAMPAGQAPDRGTRVLATVRALKNLSADLVCDHVRQLLESGCWREYRLPNGRSYRWQASEFDYFLAAVDLDPRLVEGAVREVGDRDVLLALAAASNQHDRRRRNVEQVAARYPDIAPRLAAHQLGGPSLHKLLAHPDAQERFRNGSGADVARRERHWWRVTWSGAGSNEAAARAIVSRLRREPGMVEAVRQLLNEESSL